MGVQACAHTCAMLPLRAVSTFLGHLPGSCRLLEGSPFLPPPGTLGAWLLPAASALELPCVGTRLSGAQPQGGGFWPQHGPPCPRPSPCPDTALHCLAIALTPPAGSPLFLRPAFSPHPMLQLLGSLSSGHTPSRSLPGGPRCQFLSAEAPGFRQVHLPQGPC